MTFEEWWMSQPLDIRKMGPSMAAVEAAWNAGIKAEREACAKACEDVDLHSGDHLKNSDPRVTCAAAIRSR